MGILKSSARMIQNKNMNRTDITEKNSKYGRRGHEQKIMINTSMFTIIDANTQKFRLRWIKATQRPFWPSKERNKTSTTEMMANLLYFQAYLHHPIYS